MSPIARQILLESVVLPFALAALMPVLGRLLPGRLRLALGVGAALVVGFLAAYVAVHGWPGLTPVGAAHKLPAIAVVGLIAGGALARLGPSRLLWRSTAMLTAALVVGWLAWPRLDAPTFVAPPLLLWLAGTLGLAALEAAPGRARALVMLIATALGLAGVAYLAHAVSIMQLALGLAAAVAGAGCSGRYLRPALVLPAGALLLALGAILALYSDASLVALALLALVPAADRLSVILARTPGWHPRSLFVPLCALLPVLAVVIARLAAGPPGIW